MTTDTKTSLKGHIDEMRADLQAMLGENRLQRHLLGMELHDRLDAFERRHADLYAAVGKAGQETVDALREAIADLRKTFDELRHQSAAPAAAPTTRSTRA